MKRSMRLSIVLAVATMFLAAILETATAQSWYSPNWAYRRAVMATNPGGTTLTDYQVQITLTSSFDFTKAKSDGSDVRVTADDGTTLIPFWIENWNAGAQAARIWAKVPVIPSGGVSLYLYYGNAAGVSVSNGVSTFRFFDDFESWAGISPSSGWQDKATLPTAIADLATAVYNGKIYTFGGYGNGPGNPLNKNYEYDPGANAWTEKVPMPTARWGMVAVEFDGLIYVFGGSAGGGAGNVAKNEVYDPTLNSWTTKADIPSNLARQGVMAVRFGNRIHLFYESYHYEYDPTTDSFTQKADVPIPRFWCTSAVVGSKIYLIGGHHGGVATNDNQEYTPATDSWTTKAPLPVSLWGATRENPVINGKIYVTHGLDGSVFHASNYVFDPAANTWEEKGPAAHPRDGVGCGVVNNRLYVIGGRADFGGPYGLAYNEIYDPSLDTWTPQPGPSLWATSGASYVFADASAKYQGNYGLVVEQQANVATQRYAQSVAGFGDVYALDFCWNMTDALGISADPRPQGWVFLTDNEASGSVFFYNASNIPVVRWYNGSFGHLQNSTWNSWHNVTIIRNGTTSKVVFDGTQYLVSGSSGGAGRIKLGVYWATKEYFDNVRVRKWVTPEPGSSIGAEQIASGVPETVTCSSVGGGGYSFPLSKIAMTFGVLPSGGGTVTVRRYLETPPYPTFPNPPAGSTYIPVWFDITSSMAPGSFAVTVSADVSGVSGFGPTSQVAYYNGTTNEWVPIGGSYSSGTFTFTTTHFAPFAFLNPSGSSKALYVSSSATSASPGVIYANRSWRSDPPPAPGYTGEDDWSFSGAQPVSVYIVPQSDIQFGACDFTLEWDHNVLTLAGVDFGVKGTGGSANGLFGAGQDYPFIPKFDQLGTLNRVRITCSRTDAGNFSTAAGDYIAKLNFTLVKPGHSTISIIGLDCRYYNAGSAPTAVYLVPSNAEVKAYLSDVASLGNPTTGDGKIDINDLTPWSLSYWSGYSPYNWTNYKVKYDFGPTQDKSFFTLPVIDQKIDFEDLMIFSIGYNLSASHVLPKVPAKAEEPMIVYTGVPGVVGGETRVPVHISGTIQDVRGMSIVLKGQFGKFLGVEKGTLLANYTTPTMVMSRSEGREVFVDLAVMGLDAEGLQGAGEIAVLRFEGEAEVEIARTETRNSRNETLTSHGKEQVAEIPTSYSLEQNYPNPFNPVTTLGYQVPVTARVEIAVYNILGEKIATLVNGVKEAGTYRVEWNGRDAGGRQMASGIYLYSMRASEFVNMKKMVLLK
jgi:N-acetylneuraminic acid mutarotase